MSVQVDQGLATVSDGLVFSAMAAYTVSLVSYAIDLAAARSGRQAADPTAAPAEQPVEPVEAVGVAVASGAPAAAGGRGSGAAVAVAGAPGGRREESGPAAGEAVRRRAAGIGTSVFVLAAVLHLGAVLARAASVQRVPWSDAYEFALTGSAAVSLVYLALLASPREWRWAGTFVALPVLLTLGLAATVFYTSASALSPALQSSWLIIHVSVAIAASALFIIGFSLAVLQLTQHYQDRAVARGGTRSRFLARVPGAGELEVASFRFHAVAFVLWTFTLIAGAIWAEVAWGRYWGWDPKEVWTFVIWVVYAAYLHARSTAGWAGPRSAWLATAGFACLMFNFFGVNYMFSGNHSYAL